MNRSLRPILCLLTLFITPALFAINDSDDHRVFVYQDTSCTLQFNDAQKEAFRRIADEVPNLGVLDHPVWLRIDIPPVGENSYFELQAPNIDSLFFYHVAEGEIVHADTSGEAYSFGSRAEPVPNFLFAISSLETPSAIYLRIRSGKQLILPFSIAPKEELYWQQNRQDIFFGVYAGIILVMFLYNLFIWFSVRDNNYLYYVLYIFFVGLTQLVLNGYGNVYFWPENQWLSVRSAHFCGVLSGVTTVIFAQHYLHTRQYARWWHYLLNFYLGVYTIAGVLTITGHLVLAYKLINFCAIAAFLLVIVAARIWRKGFHPALYFLIAWSIFLIGVTVFVLRDLGVLPYNNVTQYALPIGSALEVVLLSFALADRINQLKREKEREQEAKLRALRDNEQIITQQNIVLERKVNERTRELANSNEELNVTLSELRAAQAQLVDAEKMASLGQMTAGIAHELNNPINFVSSNIEPLKRDIDDMIRILTAWQAVDEAAPEERQTRIDEARVLAEELELPYIREEIDQLLRGIRDGASRTAEIVKGLRVFSRLDEDALKKADINEGIRSTLIILKSTIKSEAPVETKLAENLPEMECYPGKLNQVFMNIISNALQATAATGKPYEERKVSVSSELVGGSIVVRIADNGTGIPERVKARIFDPFFTTKEVGKGTGLGLSIVLGIINDHNGTIDVQTKEGEGTEFIITLPLNRTGTSK